MKKLKKIIYKIVGNNIYQLYQNTRLKFWPSQMQKMELNSKRKQKELDNIDLQNKINFYSKFIKQDDLCFDVGANIGNRIEPLLQIGAKIIAIEPQSSCVTYLKKEYGSKIVIIEKGVGSESGTKDFYISSSATTLSSFSNEWINEVKKDRFINHNWEKAGKIDMITLDELIDEYGIPRFIKIDVEGFELEVLKGLTNKTGIISFEYTVPELLNSIQKCLKEVSRINFNAVCNYTKGEALDFCLNEWCSLTEMENCINSDNFINSSNGDIYIAFEANCIFN